MAKAELVAHMEGRVSKKADEWRVLIKAEMIGRNRRKGVRQRSQMYYREIVLQRAAIGRLARL